MARAKTNSPDALKGLDTAEKCLYYRRRYRWPLRRIGKEVGISHVAVKKHLDKYYQERQAGLQQFALNAKIEQLESIEEGIQVCQGKAFDPENPSYQAMDRLLKFYELQGRLMGFDKMADLTEDKRYVMPIAVFDKWHDEYSEEKRQEESQAIARSERRKAGASK